MEQWKPGTVLAFPTGESFEWRPASTGRFAALKILGKHTTENAIAVATLAPIFRQVPELAALKGATVLRRDRFAFKDSPSVHFVPPPAAKVASQLAIIGRLDITDVEQELLRTCRSYAVVEFLMRDAEAEWRWSHERDALEADNERDKAQRQIVAAEQEARY